MKAKFTKGNWSLTTDSFVDGCAVTSTERVGMLEICNITDAYITGEVSDEPFEIEQLANAHLIASAPDMYKALEKLHDESRLFYGEDYDNVIELLARARGE